MRRYVMFLDFWIGVNIVGLPMFITHKIDLFYTFELKK